MNVFVNINQILCSEYILSLLICSASNSWDIAVFSIFLLLCHGQNYLYTDMILILELVKFDCLCICYIPRLSYEF